MARLEGVGGFLVAPAALAQLSLEGRSNIARSSFVQKERRRHSWAWTSWGCQLQGHPSASRNHCRKTTTWPVGQLGTWLVGKTDLSRSRTFRLNFPPPGDQEWDSGSAPGQAQHLCDSSAGQRAPRRHVCQALTSFVATGASGRLTPLTLRFVIVIVWYIVYILRGSIRFHVLFLVF